MNRKRRRRRIISLGTVTASPYMNPDIPKTHRHP
jgi:hypothetical protein